MPKHVTILLINPFFFSFLQNKYDLEKVLSRIAYVTEPLGLGSLSAYIKNNFKDIQIEVFDANNVALKEIIKTKKVDMTNLWGLVEEKIRSFAPDIVGISALFEFSGHISLSFADLAKKINKDIITVLGGAYASHSYKRAFYNKNLDFIIRGEGEEGFRQFIEYILNKRDITEVGSLIYYYDGELRLNQQVIVPDLDTIPWVDRTNFDIDFIATAQPRLANRYAKVKYDPRIGSILATRGCPYRCGFCSTRLLWGPAIRNRSITDVIDEIRWMKKKYGINTFFFPDDNICTDNEYFFQFLKLLCNENIQWISGGLQVSAMNNDEIIKLCIESGLLYMPFSFESGSDESLRKMKKPLTIKQSVALVEKIRSIDSNMCIFGSWITGLPWETIEDFENTHTLAEQLDLDWSSFYCYQPYPGTTIYKYCVEMGYIDETEDNIKSPVPLLSAISTENFTADEAVFKSYCANIDVNFLNNRNLNGRGNRDQAYRDFIDILDNYPTHVFAHYCLSSYFNYKKDRIKTRYHIEKAKECAKQDSFYVPYIKYFHLTNELLL